MLSRHLCCTSFGRNSSILRQIGTLDRQLIRYFSTNSIIRAKRRSGQQQSATEQKALLGRPSNNLRIGIVGLPNIGKSSLFNVLTHSSVPAENYPFCTIDPSEARVEVPDPRFDHLVKVYQPKKRTPAHLTVVDIAGLVRGAAQGEGLGNAFLNNVSSVDAIYHLVRVFENEDITHVENNIIDPIRDLDIIQAELRLKDEEMIERHLLDLTKAVRAKPEKKEELKRVEKIAEFMSTGKHDIRKGIWTNEEIELLNSLHLLTAKPMIYLCNMTEEEYLNGSDSSNRWMPKIKEWVDENNSGDLILPISVALETKLANASLEDRRVLLKDKASQLSNVILAGYKALNLIHYFTCGPDEVRAWTIRGNSKAPQAAGIIHSDFEKGFISAEIIKYDDLKKLGSETAVKSVGKCLQKGKDYLMEDGDIAHFKFNVTSKKKK